jgi:hypothetical protein
MAFSDELDLMSSDTQSILGSESITVRRVRPTGAIDPETFLATENIESFTATAVPGEPYVAREGDPPRRVTRNTWIVRAEDCDFRPSPESRLTVGGDTWRIVTVADQQVGREYLITAQRIA